MGERAQEPAAPDAETPAPLAVECLGMTRRYAGVVANDQIDLEVREGEVHALVGENGAGKSTLMKMLYGLEHPDEGEIRVRGQVERIDSPRKAIELRIGMVHQHFMLVDDFTVAENIVLGSEPAHSGVLDLDQATKRIEELARGFGTPLDPRARVEDIAVGQQQMGRDPQAALPGRGHPDPGRADGRARPPGDRGAVRQPPPAP